MDPDAPTGLAPQQRRAPAGGHQGAPPGQPAGPPINDRWQPAPAPGQWPPSAPPPLYPQPGGPYQQSPQHGPSWPSPPGYPPYPGGTATGAPPPQAKNNRKPAWKERKPLIIGGAVAVVLALVLVVTLSGGGGGEGGGSGSPSETVKGYLDALSRGDAEAALAFGTDEPASKDLLTDEILKKQIAKAPISDVRILGEDDYGGIGDQARVHVVAKFGKETSDANVTVKRGEDGWKMETASIKIEPPPSAAQDEAAKTLTMFDKPADTTIYVFPGYLEAGSTNDYIEASVDMVLLDNLTGLFSARISPTFTLNDEGSDAIRKGVTDAFATCQRSNLVSPPGCPARLYAYDAVEGTVTWGVTDTSDVEIGAINPYTLEVDVAGQAKTPITFRSTIGDQTRSETNSSSVYGDADLTKNPLELTFR